VATAVVGRIENAEWPINQKKATHYDEVVVENVAAPMVLDAQGWEKPLTSAGWSANPSPLTSPPHPPAPTSAETALAARSASTDRNGDIVLEFQMPEAVIALAAAGPAHDNLHSGQLARQLVTVLETRATPNALRFCGDTFHLSRCSRIFD
jgi:hypothetical protein